MMPVVYALAVIFPPVSRATATRQGSRALAAVNDNIQESVTGISVAKNFRQEAMIYDEFDRRSTGSRTRSICGAVSCWRRSFRRSTALAGFVVGTLLYIGATVVIGGAINVGSWYLFIQGVDRFWFPLINLSSYLEPDSAGLQRRSSVFSR